MKKSVKDIVLVLLVLGSLSLFGEKIVHADVGFRTNDNREIGWLEKAFRDIGCNSTGISGIGRVQIADAAVPGATTKEFSYIELDVMAQIPGGSCYQYCFNLGRGVWTKESASTLISQNFYLPFSQYPTLKTCLQNGGKVFFNTYLKQVFGTGTLSQYATLGPVSQSVPSQPISSVTLRYVDVDNPSIEIAARDTVSGVVGKQAFQDFAPRMNAKMKSLSGTWKWTKNLFSEMYSLRYNGNPQTLTLMFKRINVPSIGTIKIKYIDQDTNQEIVTSDTISGEIGQNAEYKILETANNRGNQVIAKGYDFVSFSNTKLTYAATPQEVIVKYKKKAQQGAPVTIKYLNEEDNDSIYSSCILTGNIGDPYDVTGDSYCLTIIGYKLDLNRLPDNRKGVFTNQPQEVIYYYIPTDNQKKLLQIIKEARELFKDSQYKQLSNDVTRDKILKLQDRLVELANCNDVNQKNITYAAGLILKALAIYK